MKLTDNQYNILEQLEEINKPISFNDLLTLLRKKHKRFASSTLVMNTQSLIKKLLVTITIDKKKELFSLTEAGKRALIEKPSLLPVKIKKEVKTKDSQPKKEGNWLEWTDPIWVEENNQWEFYKKQEGQILEIYHSQDEEEIRERHRSKVMEHIMAAMDTPKVKEEEGRSRHPVKHKLSEETKESINKPTTGRGSQKTGDSSTFLHLDAKHRLLTMKLQGYPQPEILMTVAREYNLKSITVGLYLTEVIRDIRERSKGIVEETLRTHLDRYESIFKWFRENGYSKWALKALERKERLIGLHDSEKVDRGLLEEINKSMLNKLGYDWSRLPEEDYKRLLTLVKRTLIILKPIEPAEDK
jgi:hypothetical protein